MQNALIIAPALDEDPGIRAHLRVETGSIDDVFYVRIASVFSHWILSGTSEHHSAQGKKQGKKDLEDVFVPYIRR